MLASAPIGQRESLPGAVFAAAGSYVLFSLHFHAHADWFVARSVVKESGRCEVLGRNTQ